MTKKQWQQERVELINATPESIKEIAKSWDMKKYHRQIYNAKNLSIMYQGQVAEAEFIALYKAKSSWEVQQNYKRAQRNKEMKNRLEKIYQYLVNNKPSEEDKPKPWEYTDCLGNRVEIRTCSNGYNIRTAS